MSRIRTFLASICLFSAFLANGVEPLDVGRCEYGANIGATISPDFYHGFKRTPGLVVELNFRYNIPETAWDAGAAAGIALNFWDSQSGSDLYRTTYAALNMHYNFKQGYKVNPYVGLGFGGARNEVDDTDFSAMSAILIPEVGVELFHHLRVNLSAMISRKGFNTFSLSVGFAIGGRPQKQVITY